MKIFYLALIFLIGAVRISAQDAVPAPNKINSPKQKYSKNKNYTKSGFLSGSAIFEADRYGIFGYYESAKRLDKSLYLTGRIILGSHGYLTSILTSSYGAEIGLIKLIYNFEDYDGENSIYVRMNSGPMIAKHYFQWNKNTSSMSEFRENLQNFDNFLQMGNIGFGFHSNIKIGYVLSVWEEYSIQIELGASHVGFLNDKMPNQNFFSPEISLGVKKSNMLEW